jgi:hypothetical protein
VTVRVGETHVETCTTMVPPATPRPCPRVTQPCPWRNRSQNKGTRERLVRLHMPRSGCAACLGRSLSPPPTRAATQLSRGPLNTSTARLRCLLLHLRWREGRAKVVLVPCPRTCSLSCYSPRGKAPLHQLCCVLKRSFCKVRALPAASVSPAHPAQPVVRALPSQDESCLPPAVGH